MLISRLFTHWHIVNDSDGDDVDSDAVADDVGDGEAVCDDFVGDDDLGDDDGVFDGDDEGDDEGDNDGADDEDERSHEKIKSWWHGNKVGKEALSVSPSKDIIIWDPSSDIIAVLSCGVGGW